jgi:hypothetical protein
MNITNAKYYQGITDTKVSAIMATIDGKLWSVPINPNNRHYIAIQEWVAEGNTIAEAD